MKRLIIIHNDLEEVVEHAAREILRLCHGTGRDRITMVLAGGSTPKGLYELLRTKYRYRVPWERVHVFWGDERFVPHDHPDSNYLMVSRALLDNGPLPSSHVHPIPTDLGDPDDCARRYEETIRAFFGDTPPYFDIVILGMGEDGHTASLFPGFPELDEENRLVVAVRSAPKPPAIRITMTLPALCSAHAALFLVTGENKRDVVRDVVANPDTTRYPAARVDAKAETLWLVDRAAAGEESE